MKLSNRIFVSIVILMVSMSVKAEHLPVDSIVLANCHGFAAKGKIKRLHKERYVINFFKDSRPVHCTPFAWDSMFLVTYNPVSEYKGKTKSSSGFFSTSKDEVFKTGDLLIVNFQAKTRGAMFSSKYSVTVKISDIDASGSGQLEIVDGEVKAQQVFQRWVGTNYVSLDFTDKLVADRLTILFVEKQ